MNFDDTRMRKARTIARTARDAARLDENDLHARGANAAATAILAALGIDPDGPKYLDHDTIGVPR